MIKYITQLPRNIKAAIILTVDHIVIIIAWYLATCLRLNSIWPEQFLFSSIPFLLWLLLSGLLFSRLFRLNYFQLAGFENHALLRTLYWIAIITVLGTIANIAFNLGAPRTVPIIFGSIAFMLILIVRLSAKSILERNAGINLKRIPIAIYGSAAQGIQLASALKSSTEYRPVLFVDDNKKLQGTIISGLEIHSPRKIETHLKIGNVKKVIFATNAIAKKQKSDFVNLLKQYDCEALEIPSYAELIRSGGLVNSLRPVEPEELLGRAGVDLVGLDVLNAYSRQNIFVSGAGGSIGSELCRQLIGINPKSIILFEMSEYALYEIESELAPLANENGIELISVLGSVCDASHVENTLSKYSVDVIIHAAAYKHVPLMESNEVEGVQNNVLGTHTLANVASRSNIKRFILISTDKAVRPVNVVGASKRLAENIVQNLAAKNKSIIFSIVRFGNVLGSSGSVIPLFKKQINNGGPLTITHREVIRYFMTISEASRLVLLAGAFAEGGEVFVLDMGKPIKIYDMAKQIIELSGLTLKDKDKPDGDIAIEFTGLRPGEKLYEELLINDKLLETPHPKILRAKEISLTSKQLSSAIKAIEKAVTTRSEKSIRKAMKTWGDLNSNNLDNRH